MNIQKFCSTTALFIFFPLSCIAMEEIHSVKPESKRQRRDADEQQEEFTQFQSLFQLTTKAFYKQNSANALMQLQQYPLPQELYPVMLNEAFISKQPKEVLLNIASNISLEDYTELAINIAYSKSSMYLSAKDKNNLLGTLRQMHTNSAQESKQRVETTIVLNALIAATKELKDSKSSYDNFTSHSTEIFYHMLNQQEIPANILQLFLNHGLPHNTNTLISSYIKTFNNVNQEFYEESLKKLSLLVKAKVPINNIEICDSMIIGGIKYKGQAFSNLFHYLQHQIACMAKQEISSKFTIDLSEKKAFFEEASILVKEK